MFSSFPTEHFTVLVIDVSELNEIRESVNSEVRKCGMYGQVLWIPRVTTTLFLTRTAQ